ncbi:hypothetical protein GNP81_05350 [Aliivibrio fischeri]|uniref:hypothetical protein n=1 Tax=Aliivibrio fischeri TaxID=668 RepID=UPI0012D8C1E3|nr:hypothetical protein [Aliivibrio fischeri]MUK63127.1 hypothetical protein [Aliivibrio fischeri]MUL20256.1 hypothetical protein [Aliivibrio fischeri]MUL24031.1 hypothetical protein [Aliivibrio fischeri]
MSFGLVCEGPTDQITIENILCGFFDDDISDVINKLQPGGASESNGEGGWERVLTYLSSYKFRDSFLMNQYVVIQIDTDVCHMKGFDIPLVDEGGITLNDVSEIVLKVKDKLISQIDSGEDDFFENNKDKIIFAISVHCLETWIFKHYNNDPKLNKMINNGESRLVEIIQRIHHGDREKLGLYLEREGKTFKMHKIYEAYDELTMPFFKKGGDTRIEELSRKDESFKFFIDELTEKASDFLD